MTHAGSWQDGKIYMAIMQTSTQKQMMAWHSRQLARKEKITIRKKRLHDTNVELSNKCDKEQAVETSNKKGSSFLVVNDYQHTSSSDEENIVMSPSCTEFTALQEAYDEDAIEESSDANIEEGSTEDDDDGDDQSTLSEDDDYQGFALLNQDILCSNQDKPSIPRNWILLDSQSTVYVFSNANLLTNIGDAKRVLTLHCNAGKAIVTQKGDLKGYNDLVLSQEHSKQFVSTQGSEEIQSHL